MANNTESKQITPQAVEFQPDALEIKNEKLPLWLRYSVIYALLFIVGAIVWASISEVDVIVPATGKIVTNESSIIMKPLEKAVIKKIHVKIGQIVKKGDVLITFDPTLNLADAERLAAEVEVLSAQCERLNAEFSGKDYQPKVNNAATRRQKKIFDQKTLYFRSRCSTFDESIKEQQANVKAREDALRNQEQRLIKLKEIEKAYFELSKIKAVAPLQLTSVQISTLEMEAAIDEQKNKLLELKHQINSAKASRQSFINNWEQTISEELVTAERELSATLKTYEKAKRLVEYVELRAPCESVVHEIASFPVGSAVQEAEALVTLVPLSEIELEAEIPPHYISKVHPGSQARVKLNAYPFQKHGTLNGMVRNISENTLKKNIQGQELTYYRSRVVVSGKLKGVKENFRLIPGMEAQCEIKCGRRRVIEFVLHPLIKALDETAREP